MAHSMTLSRAATFAAALRIERPVNALVAMLVLAVALVLGACHRDDFRSDDPPPPTNVGGALDPAPVIAPVVTPPAPAPVIAPIVAPPAPPEPVLADTASVDDVSAPPAAPLTDADRARARQCTMDADHACVIRLLEGRAETESDLAMLIEACRASGQTHRALRYMRIYIERYPTRPRARGYQMIIARSG